MSLLILVVDDEPDVEALFRQHFRRDLRAGRFTMEFAYSASAALDRIGDAAGVSLILILSDINMPGMSGLELLPKAKALRPDVPVIMITAYGDAETKRADRAVNCALRFSDAFAQSFRECWQQKGSHWESPVLVLMQGRRSSAISVVVASSTTQPTVIP